MKNREGLIWLAILAWLFWPKRSTSAELFKVCVFPDGTAVTVPLGAGIDCPYDDAHGGQSEIEAL